MKKNKIILVSIFSLILFSLSFSYVLAFDLMPDLNSFKGGSGYQGGENTIPRMIGNVVAAVLTFVAAIFFILIIASGIQWMTAGGNEEKVKKSKTRLINASIGLAITLGAYFITWFISEVFLANA